MKRVGLIAICLLVVLFGIYIYYLFFGLAFKNKNILKDKNKSIFEDINDTPPQKLMLKNPTDCDCD